jgi:DNA-directed RNA polymerase specialized sigma24 family protein
MATSDNSFDEFLMRLEPQAASPADVYLRLRVKLVRIFVWNRCPNGDAEELADETIKRLVSKVEEGCIIENAPSYVKGVAGFVLKEYRRKAARLTPLDATEQIEQTSLHPDETFVECARFCMAKLPDDKRRLLEQYYSDEGGRAELAERAGLTLAALRTKVHRFKADLKQCYQKCAERGRTYEERN